MRVPVDEPHTACKDCLRGWIEAQTSELSVFIRCPFPNCKVRRVDKADGRLLPIATNTLPATLLRFQERMQLDDVHAVWPEKAFELQQRMEQDLGTSWREMTEAERSQIEAELPITVCPACELVFVKDEGCDTVVCLCGE